MLLVAECRRTRAAFPTVSDSRPAWKMPALSFHLIFHCRTMAEQFLSCKELSMGLELWIPI